MIRNLKLFSAGLMLLSTLPAGAVIAFPGLIKTRQSDGKELLIRRVGDEYHNLVLSEDGYALLFNARTSNYEYATLTADGFRSSGIMAAAPESRSAEAKAFLSQLDLPAMEARFNSDWGKAREAAKNPVLTNSSVSGPQKVVRMNGVPTLGEHDVCVILVQFSDVKFTDSEYMTAPVDYYNRFFHQEGFSDYGCHGSAFDFYTFSSQGRYKPNFKVYGPVTLSGTHSDYAGTGGHKNTYKMIQEAVQLADSQYDVDFAGFDTDGDGKADNVYCIYAGYGQADSADDTSIWPHSSNLSNVNAMVEVDGVNIDRYTVSQQLNGQSHKPVGIGTFVHEFGHVLGLADHYNTASSMGNPLNNVGNWDLMSAGSYNNDQNTPAPLSSFERYSLGWGEPETLDPVTPGVINIDAYTDSGQCYRIDVLPDDKEYFLIENRQKKDWDAYLPGHGVLVWHIEENQLSWNKNQVNTDQSHQRVDIVEASKVLSTSGLDSDTFPGSYGVRSFSFFDWDNTQSFGFDWVEEDEDGKCWFLLSNSDYLIAAPNVSVSNLMGTSADLNYNTDQAATNYAIDIYKGDEIVFSHKGEGAGSVTVSGLEPLTEYTVKARALLNTLKSEETELTFSTTELQIEEYKPQAMGASDFADGSFRVYWTQIDKATDYEIALYSSSHDAKGELKEGFDNYSASNPGLPEGWEITAKPGRYEETFGSAAPSIRMRDDNASLLAKVPGEKLDELEFWFQPSKAGLGVKVEKLDGDVWSEVYNYISDRKREMTQSVSLDEADAVRITVIRGEGVSGGYVLLDDVTLKYTFDRFAQISTLGVGPSYNDTFDAGNFCSYLFKDLNDGEYGYAVRGEAGDSFSQWSEIFKIDPDNKFSGIESTLIPERASETVIYNLQGIRVSGSVDNLPDGIYIVNGRKMMIRH